MEESNITKQTIYINYMIKWNYKNSKVIIIIQLASFVVMFIKIQVGVIKTYKYYYHIDFKKKLPGIIYFLNSIL